MSLAFSTGVNALYVLALQVLALVSLDPADFGAYSIQYLAYALSSSICMSVISEAWLRRDLREGKKSGWSSYSAVLFYFCCAAGALTFLISLSVPYLSVVAWQGAVAVAASAYRTGARYYATRFHNNRYVLLGDLAGLIVTVVGWALVQLIAEHSLASMVSVWAAGALAAALFSRLPVVGNPSVVKTWAQDHGLHIKPLLRDSLLLDFGAVGTPLLLAPILGLADFGTYRAISNVSAPVRLVLTPIRPLLAAAPLAFHQSKAKALLNFVIALSFGALAWCCLAWLAQSNIDLGTLSALTAYAVPAAIFVAANFIGHFYYIVARAHATGRDLFAGRVAQTLLVTVLPLIGVVFAGLDGAIWLYTIATCLWSIIWVYQTFQRRPS